MLSSAYAKLRGMESSVPPFAARAVSGRSASAIAARCLPLWPPHVRGAGWRAGDGLGTVHATRTIRPVGEAARDLSLVDLDAGARVTTRIVGIAPEDVAVGMRVRLAWDGEVPVFAPAA